MLKLVTRFFEEKPKWRYSTLISPSKIVYQVRDAEGLERQICSASTGEWTDESKAKFSHLEIYEDFHRTDYRKAVPTDTDKE